MPPAAASSSSQRRYSGAISTAASPLQGNFSLSCRSPLRPSYDAGQDDPLRRSLHAKRGGPFLAPPPQFFVPSISTITEGSRVIYESPDGGFDGVEADDDKTLSDAESQDSAADETWFLQQPGAPSSGWRAGRRAARGGDDDGKLGVFSAIGIIVGKTVGVGAYSVPSAVFSGVGSVGMTLLLWVVGSLISFCGLAVYLDLGTALPRSGGERVYLERIFRRPHMLATCMFAAYTVLLGLSAPNAIVLGEHALYAAGAASPPPWASRAVAAAAVSLLCWVHAARPRLGLRLLNVLGAAKMLALFAVVAAGVAGALRGAAGGQGGGEEARLAARRPGHDDAWLPGGGRTAAQRNFGGLWAGASTQPHDYATALLKVIYCFRGYGTANQVLSDVRDPVRTLRVAAPAALALVSAAYLAVSAAFFLVVDRDDLRPAGAAGAAVFFRAAFGPGAGARALSGVVVLSAAGSVAATSFAQARVNEELARDGLLPWSRFWATRPPPPPASFSRPRRRSSPSGGRRRSSSSGRAGAATAGTGTTPSPSRGLLLHWLVSVLVIALPLPGRAYDFLVDVGGYPVSVVAAAVSLGLLYLHLSPSEGWSSPCRAPRAAVAASALGSCLLLVLPWVPPRGGRGEDARFAWYAYPASALAVLGSGAAWWAWWGTGGRGRGRWTRGEAGGCAGSEVIWSAEDEMKWSESDAEATGLLRGPGEETRR